MKICPDRAKAEETSINARTTKGIMGNEHRQRCRNRQRVLLLLSLLIFPAAVSGWATATFAPAAQRRLRNHRPTRHPTATASASVLRMGMKDSFLSGFLGRRNADGNDAGTFIRLEESDDEYGPGPAVIMYNVPGGIDDEEFSDMLSDGAPEATRKGISMARLRSGDGSDLLSLSLRKALKTIVADGGRRGSAPPTLTTDAGILAGTPVLLFSGFRDREMMDSYKIMGEEIYTETSGRLSTACAKAVRNAMDKPLGEVLEEISGDHREVLREDVEGIESDSN